MEYTKGNDHILSQFIQTDNNLDESITFADSLCRKVELMFDPHGVLKPDGDKRHTG